MDKNQVGYSKRSLVDKLGVKTGDKVAIINAPKGFQLGQVVMETKLKDSLDFIHFFAKSGKELSRHFPKLKKSLKADGSLWISWPKKSSAVKSDLNENVVRKIGLANGLVDVKVAAIDEIWSGLKFVFRVKDRNRF